MVPPASRPTGLTSPLRAGPPHGVLPHTPREQGRAAPFSCSPAEAEAFQPRQGFALRACILTRFLPAVGLRLPVQPLTRFPLEQPQTALGAVFRGWVGVE